MTQRKTDTDASSGKDSAAPLIGLDSAVFGSVKVRLDARLGQVGMTVSELLALKAGEVVTLETGLSDLVELQLNGNLVARGEIVAVNDAFGVRIVEIAPAG